MTSKRRIEELFVCSFHSKHHRVEISAKAINPFTSISYLKIVILSCSVKWMRKETTHRRTQYKHMATNKQFLRKYCSKTKRVRITSTNEVAKIFNLWISQLSFFFIHKSPTWVERTFSGQLLSVSVHSNDAGWWRFLPRTRNLAASSGCRRAHNHWNKDDRNFQKVRGLCKFFDWSLKVGQMGGNELRISVS